MMTPTQTVALKQMMRRKWHTAHELGCSLATLRALLRQNFVFCHGGTGAALVPRKTLLFMRK